MKSGKRKVYPDIQVGIDLVIRKASPILKISRVFHFSRYGNLEAAAPISSFFLLYYTREISRFAFLKILFDFVV
jgi:hypothetical protein